MRTIHLCNGLGGSLWTGATLGWDSIYAIDGNHWRCTQVARQAEAGIWPGLRVECADLSAWSPAASGVDGPVDLLAAGFSCRDISAAGGGRGITGPSTGPTYAACLRAIEHFRPARVFFENSPRIRTKGRDVVTGDLVANGYRYRDGILAAVDVKAPHIRPRWFLYAERTDLGGAGQPGACADPWRGPGGTSPERRDHSAGIPAGARASASDALRHGLQIAVLSRGLPTPEAQAIEAAAGYCEAHAWNPFDAEFLPVVDGVADRAACIAALGDAWVPLQAATAWCLLGGPVT